MVTGTTRSSGPASIITGVTRAPKELLGERAQELRVAGKREADLVQRLLLDRIGDDRRRRAAAHQLDARRGSTRSRPRCRRQRFARASQRPAARPRGTAERSEKTSAALFGRRHGSADVATERTGRAARAAPSSPTKMNGGMSLALRASQASMAMSGPMPAGSPSVRASGFAAPRRSPVLDDGVGAQVAEVAPGEQLAALVADAPRAPRLPPRSGRRSAFLAQIADESGCPPARAPAR